MENCVPSSCSLQVVVIYTINSNYNEEHFKLNNLSRNNLTDLLILSLLNPYITSAINKCYCPYFNTELEVYNYENEILDITSSNYLTVRIGVFPQIGAHNPVGYDRLTYTVDANGTVILQKYEHLASYEIPPHLKESITKPLPRN